MLAEESIRVSYLITTWNRADYLERTLKNVREFIEPQDELIIIDGESTDRTKEVVGENRDIVTVFISEKDCGEAHAFNKGLFRARGRLLKPITDDDYFYPEAMRKLVVFMDSHNDIDAILCGGEVWRIEDNKPVFQCYRFLPPDVPATPESIFDHASIGLGLIVRRSVFERIGGVSANYVSVDGDLICRLLECKCQLRYLDINLYKWHIYPHSGFKKSAQMEHDRLLFAARLGRWEEIFLCDPDELANALNYPMDSLLAKQLNAIWALSKLARSPLNTFLYILIFIIRLGKRCSRLAKRLFHRRYSSHSSTTKVSIASNNREWTEALR